jgi:hypothetical protein
MREVKHGLVVLELDFAHLPFLLAYNGNFRSSSLNFGITPGTELELIAEGKTTTISELYVVPTRDDD